MNFSLLQRNLGFLREFDEKNLSDFQKRLEIYEKLFQNYGKVHNISAFKQLENEIVDSLKILDFKDLNFAQNAIDIGSGAGFPALFLALILRAKFTLFEPNAKKAAFLMLVKSELGLGNVCVVKSKIENYKEKISGESPKNGDKNFKNSAKSFENSRKNLKNSTENLEKGILKRPAQLITSRALMKIPRLITLCEGFYDENSLFLFYKGSQLSEELKEVALKSELENLKGLKHENLKGLNDFSSLKNCEIFEFGKRNYCILSVSVF